MENEQKQEALVSVISSNEEIIIQFSDGLKIMPPEIIDDLGKDYFLERATAFAGIELKDFLRNYQKTVEKRKLNQIQNEVISNHFGSQF